MTAVADNGWVKDCSLEAKQKPLQRTNALDVASSVEYPTSNAYETWLRTSTIHGASHAAEAGSPWLRRFWLLFMAVSAAFTVPQIANQFNQYVDDELAWGTQVFEQLASEPHLRLPDVKICNFNRFLPERAKDVGLSDRMFGTFKQQFDDLYTFEANATRPEELEALHAYLASKNVSMLWLIDQLSPTCEQTLSKVSTLLDIRMAGELVGRLSGAQLCNASVRTEEAGVDGLTVSYEYDQVHGRCIRLHFAHHVTVSEPGVTHGVRLLLHVALHANDPAIDHSQLDYGFVVQLGYNGHFDGGLHLTASTGMHTWLGIQQYNVTLRQPTGYEDPISSDHPQACRSHYNELYSSEMCRLDCTETQLVNECGCTQSYVKAKVRRCTYEDEDCADQFRLDFIRRPQVRDAISQCIKGCQPRCINSFPDVRSCANRILLDNQLPKLAERLGLNASEVGPMNFALIDLYYRSLTTMIIERYRSTTLSDLLSRIGGQLGLWLGASILSMVHIVVTAVPALCHHVGRLKRVLS